MLILVTGGAGSGKSLLAEQLCLRLQCRPMYYLATMEIWDAECRMRVEKHRRQRAGKGFETLEVPFHLAEKTAHLQGGCGLLECIGNLTANEQFGCRNPFVGDTVAGEICTLAQQLTHLVVVTNEVFTDGVPADAAMREYLRHIGRINCRLAEKADIVLEAVAGLPEIWKGEERYAEIMG